MRKLRGRSIHELRGRFSQAASRWLERRGVGDGGELTGAALSEVIGSDDGGPVIRGPFVAAFDDRQATLAALTAIDPGFEAGLRLRADRLLRGRYDLLGHEDLTFGDPVDWWLEPVAGVRAPDAHWSDIAFLDPAIVGDHKLVWELGRHRALITLGQAAWCTGDERYVSGCARLLDSFMDRSPPKRGLHWASSLEVSFRSIAWVWTLAFLGDSLPQATRRRATGYLAMSARHVEQYLSTWFSPNTHLTGEALGLFILGTALPQCRDAARWRETGARILVEWLPRHVRPDGTYVEQSTWYHRYTTDFYLWFLVLAGRSGMALGGPVRERVEALLNVLAWVTRPDGSMPLIGDDDGGRLAFLDEHPANVTRGSLAIGAALFERADLAAIANAPTAELAWLLGPEGLDRFRRLTPRLPDAPSRAFRDGGLYVMRSGWDPRATVLTVDAGPHGFMNAGHAHADALSLDVTVGGHPLFVDPGTFTYTGASEWRDHFRSTASHNATTVDGRDSAVVDGAFSWRTRCDARADAWAAGRDVVLFSGTHDGFQHLAPPVAYRRSIVLLAPMLWIVRDEIDPSGGQELATHWQCAAGIRVDPDDAHMVLAHNDERLARIWSLDDAAIEVTDGWVSPVYGRKLVAPHLVIRPAAGKTRVITTLIAADGIDVAVASSGAATNLLTVTTEHGSGTVLFGGVDDHGVKSDARLGWIERESAGGSAVFVMVSGAQRLSVDGEDVPIDANGNGTWMKT